MTADDLVRRSARFLEAFATSARGIVPSYLVLVDSSGRLLGDRGRIGRATGLRHMLFGDPDAVRRTFAFLARTRGPSPPEWAQGETVCALVRPARGLALGVFFRVRGGSLDYLEHVGDLRPLARSLWRSTKAPGVSAPRTPSAASRTRRTPTRSGRRARRRSPSRPSG